MVLNVHRAKKWGGKYISSPPMPPPTSYASATCRLQQKSSDSKSIRIHRGVVARRTRGGMAPRNVLFCLNFRDRKWHCCKNYYGIILLDSEMYVYWYILLWM